MDTFGMIGKEFINLYSKDNPILKVNDECYFLFTNINDYHRPLIGRGVIIDDKFSEGMDKTYYIRLTEIVENPNVINEFIYGQQFQVNPYDHNVHPRRMVKINSDFNFHRNLLMLKSFFVRQTQEKIIELRKDYTQALKKDILKQLQDIENI